jgi:hypothetical protein
MSNKINIYYEGKSKNCKANKDDLMLAIKHVAKEMAEAVKNTKSQTIDLQEVTEKDNQELSCRDFKNNISISKPLEIFENKATQSDEDEDEELFEPKGHCVIKKYTLPKTNNNIVKKFYNDGLDAKNIKENKLDIIRNKKQQNELKNLKAKPDVSENSRKIIKEKLANVKPIYKRIDEVLKTKEEELSLLNHFYNVIENEDLKELSKSRILTTGNADKFEQFYRDQIRWLKTKQNKLSYIQGEIARIESEIEKGYYKPVINKKSQAIVKFSSRTNVHERLFNEHEQIEQKKALMVKRNVPNFKPDIVKTKLSTNKSMVEVTTIDFDPLDCYGGFEDEIINGYKKELNKGSKWEINVGNPYIDHKSVKEGFLTDTFDNRDYLYRLNIRDDTTWCKNKENKIILLPTKEKNNNF